MTAEHIFHQQTPMGDLMVLVREGIDGDQLAAHFGETLSKPTTEHEEYCATT